MLGLRKRKHCEENAEDDAAAAISGDLKRVRITITAGELRLQRDIDELRGYSGISIGRGGDRANCAILEFDPSSVTQRGDLLPSKFYISVPRYYPHHPPQIRCLDQKFRGSPFFDKDGVVHHPELEERWTPIMSLHNVVQSLLEIRLCFASSSHSPAMIMNPAGLTNGALSPDRMNLPFHRHSLGIDGDIISTPRGVDGVPLQLTYGENNQAEQTHLEYDCSMIIGEEIVDPLDSAMATDDA